MVELPAPGAGIGFTLKPTVVPDGTPEAESAMEELNPVPAVVVTVEMSDIVRGIKSDAGEADTVKVGAAETVRVTVVLLMMPPPVPVTVMG
jgi:hypothetical protein